MLLFPDNTVLINFALIRRMDLLERLANGNGRWCASVASECRKSSRREELGALARAAVIFGEPLYPDRAELQDTLALRAELEAPGDAPDAHLGESETLAIMIRRDLRGFFVTDDRAAMSLAARKRVQAVTTWQLLLVATKTGFLDPDTLWGYVQTLDRSKRAIPPGVRDRLTFDAWLANEGGDRG